MIPKYNSQQNLYKLRFWESKFSKFENIFLYFYSLFNNVKNYCQGKTKF